VLLKCHIGFRGEVHSSCRQMEGQEGPCCCKKDDDGLAMSAANHALRALICFPSQVAPMTWGSVDLDDSVRHLHILLCCLFATITVFDELAGCEQMYWKMIVVMCVMLPIWCGVLCVFV